MVAVAQADATIIVGVLSLVGVLVTVIGVQVKVHRDNRTDHNSTAEKVDQLLVNQSELRRDVNYVRADLSTIRGEITELRADVADLRHVDNDTSRRVARLEDHRITGGDAA